MTDDLLRGDDQSQSENDTLGSETTSRSGGEAAVFGQAGETVVVTRPAPGQTVEIQAVPGQTYVLSFPPGQAQVQVEGDNFILGFDDNGDGTPDSQVVFLNLVNVADAGDAPTFQIAGVDIGSEVLLGQALALAGQDDVQLDEVAAGPGGLGGGATAYSDNLGSILDLLVAQGVIPPVFLEFGLIELEDEIVVLDEAEGEIELSFRTETDGGEGAVNTWEGGFEDWQPNQDDCDPEQFPMQVIIGFTPADNEELVSFTLSGIPAGAQLFVGGVLVDTSGGSSPLLTPADLAAGLTLLPPEDSGDDIPLTVTATIVDPDSGDSSVISGSATAIIDSVADNPEFELDGEIEGGNNYYGDYGGCEDDGCEVIVSKVTYSEDNGADGGEGCHDCPVDGDPIFGAGFKAAVTDEDGSESLTRITVATTTEAEPLGEDTAGLEVALSGTDDPTATNFMIGDQVLVDGETVEVVATVADGSVGLATATIDITGGVLTLTFDPALRVQKVDLSGDSDTPFQVRLPQHSDDDFHLNLEVTAQEFVIDGELTLDNNEATHQAVLQVEVKAVADGASFTAPGEPLAFAEDDEPLSADHGADSGETGLVIPLASLGAQLIDKDGSEAIAEIKVHLEGADAGAEFVDAYGYPLGETLEITIGDAVVTADVSFYGGCLILTFDGSETAGLDIDLSNLIGVKLPIDDSEDFTVHLAATTTEVHPEGDVACETKTTETSFDVHVGGVAGPAAVAFGDYDNFPGCADPQVDGNTLTLSVFEDNQGSVDGQDGAGPLVVPVFFTAATQDNDGSEKITQVTLDLEGAPEGTVFTNGVGGDPLLAGDVIAGGTVSFVDGQLVLTFAAPGLDSVDLSGIAVELPLHSDDDFSIQIKTTTTEYDDDGVGALVDSHETDATIVVKVDAVADPVTVSIDAVSASGDEAFAPDEAGTVTVDATFGDFEDGSEVHTVTVKVPFGFTVTDLDGGTLVGDTITWTVTGETFQAVLGVKANDNLTVDETVKWKAKAKAVEQNENTDPLAGDAECTTENNTAVAYAKDKVTLDPALPPEVSVSLQGEALCIKEDGTSGFAVTATAQGDDFVSQILVENLPTGWGVSIIGSDAGAGGSFNPATGIYTTGGNPANVVLVVELTPPADSDLDVLTEVGADITFTATAQDPQSGDTADSAAVEVDVNVDAVADDVTVNITVNDDDADDGNQFSPGETGSVHVEATFGDATDGSETHTVTVEIPDGFIVGTLTGLQVGVTAEVNGDGDVVFTLGSGVTALDYTFEVTAPVDGVGDNDLFFFKATAKAEETPDDAECDLDDNVAVADDLALMYGEAAGEPEVGLEVRGNNSVKEDDQTDIAISANVTTAGDTLTQVVVTAPAGWVLNATAGGDIASVAGDGTTSLTLTLVPGVTSFSEIIQATPPEDTDVDATFTVTATAVDGLDSSEGSSDFPVVVDAILDHALELGADGVVSGDEADGEQTFGLGLDSSIVNPFPGSNDGGADTDGSEPTTVTLTLNAALPVGAVLSSTAPGASIVGGPLVYAISGADLEAIIDGLQVTLPGGFEGLISGTITTESREANTPEGTAGASGDEPDETDNVWTDSVDFAVRIAGGEVEPSAAIGLPQGVAAIKEDSENNQVNFSASADNVTDELTSIVIELPGVAEGDVDVAQITADLVGIGSVLVSEAGGVTTITITFDDAEDVQNFSSSFTLDAPVEDSDADLTGVKITANAKDITDPGATGSGDATTTIVVDAVLDEAGSAIQGTAPSEAESADALEINLDLSLGFVPAGFGLSGAGGTDTDGSEAITSVTVTISTGVLELGAGAPAGSSLTDNGGGNYTVNVGDPADYADAIAALQVEVPGGFEGAVTGSISVTTQEVSPNGGEPDLADNSKTIVNNFSATVTGGGVVPTAALALAGAAAAIKEDSVDNVVEFQANANNLTDELTTVVIELPGVASGDVDVAQITADLTGIGSVLVSEAGGTTTITITFDDADDVQSFSSSFTLDAPDQDSDVDLANVKITANAKDIGSGVTGSGDATTTIVVDAILDTALELGAAGATGGAEQAAPQSIGLGLDSSFIGPFAGSGDGGIDEDLSESTTVTLTLDGPLPDGATLTSTGGTVSPTGDPLVFTITGANLEQAIDGLQVNLPGGFEGVISGTVTTTSTEANTPQGAAPASGQEPDVNDNTRSDSVDFAITVTGGGVVPTAAIGLAGGADCIKEDSTDNVVEFSASANNPTDELTSIVIELPGVASGDVDITAINTALVGIGSASVVTALGTTTITITFDDPDNVQNFASSFTLDAPVADSDLDILDVTITANAKDSSSGVTGSGGQTIDIVVDAVADGVGSGLSVEITSVTDGADGNTSFQVGETGKVTVLATFGDFTDGSETHTVSITVPTGFSFDGLALTLPPGVTFDAGNSTPTTAVFQVSSTAGPDSVTIDLEVTNDSSADSLVVFAAEAKTVETNTPAPDLECDPNDNVASIGDTANAEVDGTPVLVVGENTDDEGDETQDHRIQNPDGEPDGNIVGNGTSDVLVGDVGGSNLINKVMNIALVLDTSGSMDAGITFNGQPTTRIQALDQAVETLLDGLAGTSGATVRVHMVSFANNVKEVGTFDIVVNGVINAAALLAAKNFIMGPGDTVNGVADGSTNYEAGFDAALDWYSNPANTLNNPDFNQTIFISDGAPNRAYIGNGSTVGTFDDDDAVDHVLGEYDNGNDDTFSEFDALQGVFEGVNGTVDSIGINVSGGADDNLDQLDDDGDADNISTGQQLLEVLGDLTQVNSLADVGSDSIVGSGGDDLIFGDAVFTDLLAIAEGINLPPGSGWAVIEALVAGNVFFNQDPGKTVNEEIMDFLRDPANQDLYDLARESLADGVGRGGGHDTIDGGAGDDTIFGQEGNDVIQGGAGEDVITGGTGNDTMTGGTGERDTFRWTAADHGVAAGGTPHVYNFAGTAGIARSFEVDPTNPNDSGNLSNLTGGAYPNTTPGFDNMVDVTANAGLDASDNSRFQSADPGNGDNQVFWAQFTVDEELADITKIDLLIEGLQADFDGADAPAHFGVWNYNTNSWDLIDSATSITDTTWTISITSNFDDYLGGAGNDQITMILMNQDDGDPLWIDYVEVAVTSSGSASVTDTITDFDLGASGDLIDLDDLLPGGVTNLSGNLTDYLRFSFDGVNTVMHVDHDGGGTFQPTLDIVIGGAGDLTAGGTVSNADIIQNLIDDNNLAV